jgi:hypothetical protein
MRGRSPIIYVMAKAPAPGAAKTRLCPPLHPVQAARLAEAFLLDTVTMVERAGCHVAIMCPGAAERQAMGEGLASAEHSLLGPQRPSVASLLDEAQRRADRQGISLRGAGAMAPRESLGAPSGGSALARLQPTAASRLHYGAGDRVALLHRALYRRSIRPDHPGELPGGRGRRGVGG